MRNIIVILFIISLLAACENKEKPIVAEVIENGSLQCFPKGLLYPHGAPVHCEASAVIYFAGKLIIANDKDIPEKSPLFSIDYQEILNNPEITFLNNHLFKTTQKIEAMCILKNRKIAIASSAFDRVKTDANDWDSYNNLIYWNLETPQEVKLITKTDSLPEKTSLDVRNKISKALANENFIEGMPYFKIEGLTELPNNKLLFGVRESGSSYKDFDYGVTFLEVEYSIDNQNDITISDFKKVYSFNVPDTLKFYENIGVSSLEYDQLTDKIFVMTSYEKDSLDTGVGAYLWYIDRLEMYDNKPLTIVRKPDNSPLHFAHKAEGMCFVDENTLFIVHDDDRILGSETITDIENQFKKEHNEMVFSIIMIYR